MGTRGLPVDRAMYICINVCISVQGALPVSILPGVEAGLRFSSAFSFPSCICRSVGEFKK